MKNERNDCAVIAISQACDITYKESWEIFAKNGRKPRTSTDQDLIYRVIHQLGFSYQKVKVKAKTIRTLERELGEGVFLVRVSGHVLCIRDGVNKDWTKGRLHRIEAVHRITSAGCYD